MTEITKPFGFRKYLVLLFGTTLLAVVFGVAYCFRVARSPYEKAAASLPAELKAAKAEGLSLEPDELNQTPRVPDKRNAALLYQQVNLANVSTAEDDALAAVRKPHPTAAERTAAAA